MRQLKITKQITVNEAASLDKYFREISHEPLITAEEEAILAQKVKQGDEKAIEKLTKANLRFVVSVAKQYQGRGLPLSDLINEGNIGLIKAAKRFDESRGFKLITYAVWWIRQCILQAIEEQSRMVKLPSGKLDMLDKIRKVIMKMEQQFHREPSYEEIGNEISLSAEAVKDILSTNTRQVSIDAPLIGGDDLTLMDTIEDKDMEYAEQDLVRESLKRKIATMIATLPEEEADVLSRYFGLNGNEPATLEKIGEKYGFTRERVRQIKEKGLMRLKHTSRCKLLKDYLG